MEKTIAVAAVALMLASGSAFAESNSGAARNMAETLKSTPGIGSAAPTVSGKNASAPGDSGWGNAGSRLVSGQQVSRGKK